MVEHTAIYYLYENTSEESLLRKYRTFISAVCADRETLKSDDYPPEFLVDIISFFRKYMPWAMSELWPDCKIWKFFVKGKPVREYPTSCRTILNADLGL